MSCRARAAAGLAVQQGRREQQQRQTMRTTAIPYSSVRAAAARLRVAHRLLLRARRPSFHRASRYGGPLD